jgi:hypothetical protein
MRDIALSPKLGDSKQTRIIMTWESGDVELQALLKARFHANHPSRTQHARADSCAIGVDRRPPHSAHVRQAD